LFSNCGEVRRRRDFIWLIWASLVIVYLSSWLLLIGPLQWIESSSASAGSYAKLIVLHVLYALACYCCYKASHTSPGSVPANWLPSALTESHREVQLARASGGDRSSTGEARATFCDRLRFCASCQNFKPPRAHHCSICNRCVLRFDHHCMWIDSCIGFYNHKYFICFLVYLELFMDFTLFQLCVVSYRLLTRTLPYGFPWWRVLLLVANLGYIGVFACSVMLLLIVQLHQIAANMTQAEIWFKMWIEQHGKTYVHAYNHGTLQNLREVMGPSVFIWLVPIVWTRTNPLNYPDLCSIPQGQLV